MAKYWAKIRQEALWDEKLAQLADEKPFAYAILCQAYVASDAYGRLPAAPRKFRAIVAPLSERPVADFTAVLEDLTACGSVATYEVEGQEYLQLVGYLETQEVPWCHLGRPTYPHPVDWRPPETLVAFIRQAGAHDPRVTPARYGLTEDDLNNVHVSTPSPEDHETQARPSPDGHESILDRGRTRDRNRERTTTTTPLPAEVAISEEGGELLQGGTAVDDDDVGSNAIRATAGNDNDNDAVSPPSAAEGERNVGLVLSAAEGHPGLAPAGGGETTTATCPDPLTVQLQQMYRGSKGPEQLADLVNRYRAHLADPGCRVTEGELLTALREDPPVAGGTPDKYMLHLQAGKWRRQQAAASQEARLAASPSPPDPLAEATCYARAIYEHDPLFRGNAQQARALVAERYNEDLATQAVATVTETGGRP